MSVKVSAGLGKECLALLHLETHLALMGKRNFVPLLYGLGSVGLLAPVLYLRLQHTLDP